MQKVLKFGYTVFKNTLKQQRSSNKKNQRRKLKKQLDLIQQDQSQIREQEALIEQSNLELQEPISDSNTQKQVPEVSLNIHDKDQLENQISQVYEGDDNQLQKGCNDDSIGRSSERSIHDSYSDSEKDDQQILEEIESKDYDDEEAEEEEDNVYEEEYLDEEEEEEDEEDDSNHQSNEEQTNINLVDSKPNKLDHQGTGQDFFENDQKVFEQQNDIQTNQKQLMELQNKGEQMELGFIEANEAQSTDNNINTIKASKLQNMKFMPQQNLKKDNLQITHPEIELIDICSSVDDQDNPMAIYHQQQKMSVHFQNKALRDKHQTDSKHQKRIQNMVGKVDCIQNTALEDLFLIIDNESQEPLDDNDHLLGDQAQNACENHLKLSIHNLKDEKQAKKEKENINQQKDCSELIGEEIDKVEKPEISDQIAPQQTSSIVNKDRSSEKRRKNKKRIVREREDFNLRSLKRGEDLLEFSFTGWTNEDKTNLIDRVIQEYKQYQKLDWKRIHELLKIKSTRFCQKTTDEIEQFYYQFEKEQGFPQFYNFDCKRIRKTENKYKLMRSNMMTFEEAKRCYNQSHQSQSHKPIQRTYEEWKHIIQRYRMQKKSNLQNTFGKINQKEASLIERQRQNVKWTDFEFKIVKKYIKRYLKDTKNRPFRYFYCEAAKQLPNRTIKSVERQMMKIKKIIESPESNLCDVSMLERSGNAENSATFQNCSLLDRSTSIVAGTSNVSCKQKFTEDEEYLMYLQLRSGLKNLWKKLEKYFGESRNKHEVMYHCNYWLCQKGLATKYKIQFAQLVKQKCKENNIPYEDIDFFVDESQEQQKLTDYQTFVRSIESDQSKQLHEKIKALPKQLQLQIEQQPQSIENNLVYTLEGDSNTFQAQSSTTNLCLDDITTKKSLFTNKNKFAQSKLNDSSYVDKLIIKHLQARNIHQNLKDIEDSISANQQNLMSHIFTSTSKENSKAVITNTLQGQLVQQKQIQTETEESNSFLQDQLLYSTQKGESSAEKSRDLLAQKCSFVQQKLMAALAKGDNQNKLIFAVTNNTSTEEKEDQQEQVQQEGDAISQQFHSNKSNVWQDSSDAAIDKDYQQGNQKLIASKSSPFQFIASKSKDQTNA